MPTGPMKRDHPRTLATTPNPKRPTINLLGQSELTFRFVSIYVDSVSEATQLAAAAGNRDPRVGLRAAAALRRLAEQLEALQVQNARALGWTWQDIATELDVSKQAVHKKHSGRRMLGRS